MTNALQLLIAGITSGSIYALVALAFTLVYSSTKIVNFAQGEFVMLGAMMAFLFLTLLKVSYAVAFPGVIIALALIGAAIERLVVNPLHRRSAPIYTTIIATLAVGIVLSNGTALIFGKTQFPVPPMFGNTALRFSVLSLLPQNIVVLGMAGLEVLLLWAFLNKTVLGMAIRATGYNREVAELLGIRSSTVITLTFVVSAVISATAGLAIAPIIGAYPYMGIFLAVKGFVAAILGGMGNPFAGAIGGFILGILEAMSSFYISSSYSEVIAFILMLAVLMVRPTGLFAEHEN